MIEPILSLAMSMQSNQGVYALLLGSGISNSAGIFTGWEIVLDLIDRIIPPEERKNVVNLETWYVDKYKEQPDYSKLLDAIAKTPTERNLLLRSYFEPTEEEREQGLKAPTPAHKAIARLVAKGYIKVIITTNFDPLMEKALEAIGIRFQVISTIDGIKGALPLVHVHSESKCQCTIVKVHGNYLDTRIKNTPEELAVYEPELNQLLDRIFDEFGLIVSGWSAEWDTALRDAIIRCPNRRFTTYWTDRGRRKEQAQDLINHRRADLIKIVDADSFFQELEEKVTSLEEIKQNHPLAAKVAVQTLKRYLAEDKYKIRLHDLVMDEVNKVHQEIISDRLSSNNDDFITRLKKHESLTDVVIQLFINGCYWTNAPYGCFKWHEKVINQIVTEAELEGNNWMPLKAGLFDGSIKYFLNLKSNFDSLPQNSVFF